MASETVVQGILRFLPAVLYQYIAYKDGSGEFLYMSPSTDELLGYKSELFTQDICFLWSIVNKNDIGELTSGDYQSIKHEGVFSMDLRLKKANGHENWFKMSSRLQPNNNVDGDIWCGYIIDIHELKNLESKLLSANAKLEKISLIDELTGLSNRRHFTDFMRSEWARYERTNEPLSLLFFDIDYFKNFNDLYGHQAGDDCLRRVATALKATIRDGTDHLTRYGGEEFILIVSGADLPRAEKVADKMRRAVEDLNISHKNSPMGKVTISVGLSVATKNKYANYHELIKAADMALYKAKNNHRNCVSVAD